MRKVSGLKYMGIKFEPNLAYKTFKSGKFGMKKRIISKLTDHKNPAVLYFKQNLHKM